MDHSNTSDLLSLEQALTKMLSQVTPLQATETVALTEAAGRITASAITSPIAVPLSPTPRWTDMPCVVMSLAAHYRCRWPVRLLPVHRLKVSGQPILACES